MLISGSVRVFSRNDHSVVDQAIPLTEEFLNRFQSLITSAPVEWELKSGPVGQKWAPEGHSGLVIPVNHRLEIVTHSFMGAKAQHTLLLGQLAIFRDHAPTGTISSDWEGGHSIECAPKHQRLLAKVPESAVQKLLSGDT